MFYKLPFVDEFVTEYSPLFVAITVIFIVAAAWRSTNTTDNWRVRAVYVFDRRLRRNRHLSSLSTHTVTTTIVQSTQAVLEDPVDTDTENRISTETVQENNNSEQDERQEIIEKMDADNDIVRQRRLAFFGKGSTTADAMSGASSSSQSPETVVPSAPPLSELHDDRDSTQSSRVNQEPTVPPDTNSIRIKLKYLNDDLKSVDGKLNEPLSSFKRRHFSRELSENKRIKLIFNGQLLQREEETLRRYGLFDNCVVHCLIHQSRTAQEGNTESSSRRTGQGRNERDWDLGNLLLVLISILLSLAWYTRYNYPQLFSITSTVALVIITGLFAIISLGMFFPDQNVPNIEVHLR